MACPHCGSHELRADRSLAGRLVCGRCGRPHTSRAPRHRPRSGRPNRSRRRWNLLLGLVVAIAALVALRQAANLRSWPGPQPPQQQPVP
jgi:hypothetical protein